MRRRLRRVGMMPCAVAAMIVAARIAAHADVTSDQPAAILVFPKVVVDITAPQISPPAQIDTLIRVTNTSTRPVFMHCFYIDATPLCSSDLTQSCVSSPVSCSPPTNCVRTFWQETDFDVYLSPLQPVAWLASRPASQCQPNDPSKLPCFVPPPPNVTAGLVPQAGGDPFLGELKCIEVDQDSVPVNRNDLRGDAEIIRSSPNAVDVEAYNAIGIQATAALSSNDPNTLTLGATCIGGSNDQRPCAVPSDCPSLAGNPGTCSACPNGRTCGPEYTGCPSVLILDHFADGAPDPVSHLPVTTDLTLVPCSEDFSGQAPVTTTVQFLVFNEFEQRLSTSMPVTCFREVKISEIGAKVQQNIIRNSSVFSAALLGTLTAQTRLRGVPDSDRDHGHALLGIAEEFRQGGGTAAFNLHFQGTRPQSDFIHLPQLP